MPPREQLGEFGRILKFFRPLTAGFKGARNLTDDTASLIHPVGHELVVTSDAIVSGVHFLGDESAALIAQKALRTNLSDLAAAGARPLAYSLVTMLPITVSDVWVEEFAAGLMRDQNEYGIALLGGDSVATPGPITIAITAFGIVRRGEALQRQGAKAGDHVLVTGTLGDAALGLALARDHNNAKHIPQEAISFLKGRYHLPMPRVSFAVGLSRFVSAGLDISDGLLADAQHLAIASGVRIVIEQTTLPLSAAARLLPESEAIEAALSGGDDYELMLTVSPRFLAKVMAMAKAQGLPLTRIGFVENADEKRGDAVRLLDHRGWEVKPERFGYRHF